MANIYSVTSQMKYGKYLHCDFLSEIWDIFSVWLIELNMGNIYSVTSQMKYGKYLQCDFANEIWKYLQWGFKLEICSLLNHFVSCSHQCICIVIYVCIQRLYFHWYFKHEGDRVYDTCPTDRLVNRVNTLAHPSAILSTNISLQTIYLKQ